MQKPNPRRPLAFTLAALSSLASCAPESARQRFDRSVAPVLQRRCGAASCHGAPPGVSPHRAFAFPTDANGYLGDETRLDAAYASARRFIDTTERPELSTLLRKALPQATGGLPHAGGAAFHGRDDEAFGAVRDWIAMEHGGGEDGHPETLTEGERFFMARVQPALVRAQCGLAPCHRPAAAPTYRFDPGVDGVFGVAITRQNHRDALVQLSLGGWAERSRLALKALGDRTLALPHRGGNGLSGFPANLDDPLAREIVEWARVERRLRAPEARECSLEGIVFVGGPVGAARVVEHDGYVPGGDLYLLSPPVAGGVVRNLTAALHGAPADIRHPAVDDAATRVAFSMRESREGGTALWELDLRTGRARRITTPVSLPDGRLSSDLWPAYAPDGALWFVSDRAGVLAEHADGFDTDLYVLDPRGALTRRSFTPSPELATTFFRQGSETAGAVAFTAIRRLAEGYKGVVYRFPSDLHAEYHQHVGITLGGDITFHMRETADGDYVGLLLDRDAVWSAGALVHVDRNLGVEVPASLVGRASVPGYLPAVTYLGPYGSADDAILHPYSVEAREAPFRRAESDGAWRDPSPLPDGRIAISWAPGPVRLTDRDAPPDFGLFALTLGRDAATGALTIASRERLVDLTGVSETEPVPVYRAVSARIAPAPPTGDTGRLLYNGAPMLEGILRQVGASGPRRLRDDLRSVRILEWLPRGRDPAVAPVDPALYAEQRASGATPHAPTRVLAELPLEPDGTFFAELASGTAFRLQYLDARGMAVGTQHNRWFDIHGGQELRQGVSTAGYDARCVGCHGGRSGDPIDGIAPVDVTGGASRSLARFEGDDPDRPRVPLRLGASTALPSGWSTEVLPRLARSCATARCHDAGTGAGGLSLDGRPTAHYDAAYEALVARGSGSANGFRYVDVVGTTARGSHLVERVLGVELDAPRELGGAPEHRGAPRLSDDDLRVLTRWIESGALYCAERCP